MKELERRDFAKQTLKWGGALTLLAALNPPAVLSAGPPKGNPLKAMQKNPFLQRDDLQDFLAEFFTLVVQLDEIEPFTDGLQRFGELRIEQFNQRVLFGGAFATEQLGHLHHVFRGLVHADEEDHLDVGAQVVFTDQPFAAVPVNLHALHGDVHDLHPV